MKRGLTTFLIVGLGILTGCATFEPQTPERIRAREPVLFEAIAHLGEISPAGDRIHWKGRAALLITPTTLYSGTVPLSFATIDSIEVSTFHDVGFGPFEPARSYPDLLIVKESRGVFGKGCVIQLLPGESLSRRDLADRLAGLIETQRRAVDPFGRIDEARAAWLATGLARAPSLWAREPLFLENRDPARRKALEKCFADASPAVAAQFGEALWGALRSRGGSYPFEPLPDLAITRRGWLDPGSVKKALAGRTPARDRLLVSDLTRFTLAEQIDPPGDIRIAVTFTYYLDYYNLAPPQNGAAHWHERVVVAPLEDWLAGGAARILAEVAHTGAEAAAQLQRELTPPPAPAPGS